MINNLTCEEHRASEISIFTNSNYYTEIKNRVNILGYNLKCECGEPIGGRKRKNIIDIYFGIQIIDSSGEIVVADELDCNYLCVATCIYHFDQRHKERFMSWKDDAEFIDDLEWILSELDKRLKS